MELKEKERRKRKRKRKRKKETNRLVKKARKIIRGT